MQASRIFYLGAAGPFEYVISSVPREPAHWRIVVRGKRSNEPREVMDEELVEFANCRGEIEAVQRYINKFGPPFESEDEEFLYADTLGRWRALQLTFCSTWDRMLGVEIKNDFTETYGKGFPELWRAQVPWVKAQAEGEFRLTDRGLIFLAKTHYMALVIKLLGVSAAGKLRKCLNPGCLCTPYFIADHGKTQYCSTECGKWGQRQAKLKYWHENKPTVQKASKQAPTSKKGKSVKQIESRRKRGTRKAR